MKLMRKDPNAVLDYIFDFAPVTNNTVPVEDGALDYLEAGETIDSQEIIVSGAGIVADSSEIVADGTQVKVWISGGTSGQKGTVTCRVATSGGRQDDRSFQLKIVEM